MMTKQEFDFQFKRLDIAFNKSSVPDAKRLYYEMLGDFDARTFAAAVKDAISEERFFPPPAVLLSYCYAARTTQLTTGVGTQQQLTAGEQLRAFEQGHPGYPRKKGEPILDYLGRLAKELEANGKADD